MRVIKREVVHGWTWRKKVLVNAVFTSFATVCRGEIHEECLEAGECQLEPAGPNDPLARTRTQHAHLRDCHPVRLIVEHGEMQGRGAKESIDEGTP